MIESKVGYTDNDRGLNLCGEHNLICGSCIVETPTDSPFSAVEGAARLAIRDSEVADSSDNTICTAMTVRSHT